MTKLQINDYRRITVPYPLVLDAALAFDREHNGWLWRASEHTLTILPAADCSIAIGARRSGAAETASVERSAAWVAAALLQYCFKLRIPIPRQSCKGVELTSAGIDLIISTSVALLPIELSAADAQTVVPTIPPAATDIPMGAAAEASSTEAASAAA